MCFYNWLIEQKGLSKATASKYNLVIKNRISEWLPSYEIPKNIIEFEALRQMIYSLDIYQERNQVGNNMYSSALKHYGDYLKVIDPIQKVLFNKNSTLTTEAERLIKVRLSQTKFRKDLFDIQGCCAISGVKNSQFLIASHIKPWSQSTEKEKNDPFNGFLLTPNYDRLFDRGFITFLSTGKVCVSNKLTNDERKYFKIPDWLIIELDKKHANYLDYHQNEVFKD